jgi:hypothetical protein
MIRVFCQVLCPGIMLYGHASMLVSHIHAEEGTAHDYAVPCWYMKCSIPPMMHIGLACHTCE